MGWGAAADGTATGGPEAYPGFDEGGCSCTCANYRWVWLIVLHSRSETDCKYFKPTLSWTVANHVYTMNNACICSAGDYDRVDG